MNFDSFSHGQVVSKIWLCETLEEFLPSTTDVTILGSWHNVLAFMLLCRRPGSYSKIVGVDIDASAKTVANKICDAWCFDHNKLVENITGDAAKYLQNTKPAVVINASPEHFVSAEWFDFIAPGTLVCVQSSNIVNAKPPWLIQQPTPDLEAFKERYPLSKLLYIGTKDIEYVGWRYQRYMAIGIK